jgi:hypothetical protein
MSMSEAEVVSISSLVAESEGTLDIAKQLCEFMQQDRLSIERVRALRSDPTLGAEVIPMPLEQDEPKQNVG